MPKCELYYRPTCPFCRRVLDFIEENKIEIPLKDVTSEEHYKKLIDVGGKGQVPCLFIEDVPMFESLDIIEWLKNNFNGS